MRIALVTETFFPATDGICTRLGQMVRIMKQLGHEILIVSPDLGVDNYDGIPITKIESVTDLFTHLDHGRYLLEKYEKFFYSLIRTSFMR